MFHIASGMFSVNNLFEGEVKQNAWCEQVEAAIERVKDNQLKNLLRKIQGFSNIPRKVAIFLVCVLVIN